MDNTMNAATWAVVVATLLGPIFAVQVQKAIERGRALAIMRDTVFRNLMATRHDGARVGVDHSTALNMIEIAFYERALFGFGGRKTSGKCYRVIEAWREYFDSLSQQFPEQPDQQAAFVTQREELFTNLLYALAQERGYSFDRVQLKRGCYLPHGAAVSGQLEHQLRQAWYEVAVGQRPIYIAAPPDLRPESAQAAGAEPANAAPP